MNMRVRIKDDSKFDAVFGADCFRRNWPALYSKEGIEVQKFGSDGWWYVWDTKTDWMVNDTAFFTAKDLQCLEIVRTRDSKGRFVKENYENH